MPEPFDAGQMDLCEGCIHERVSGGRWSVEPPAWSCAKAASWEAEGETMPADQCPRWAPQQEADDE